MILGLKGLTQKAWSVIYYIVLPITFSLEPQGTIQVSKIVFSCRLSKQSLLQDLIHLVRSLSQPHNNVYLKSYNSRLVLYFKALYQPTHCSIRGCFVSFTLGVLREVTGVVSDHVLFVCLLGHFGVRLRIVFSIQTAG